jgi:hypothetical protein
MIEYRDIQKLKYQPRDFALMMDDADIERVIVEFVEVKNMRDKNRR